MPILRYRLMRQFLKAPSTAASLVFLCQTIFVRKEHNINVLHLIEVLINKYTCALYILNCLFIFILKVIAQMISTLIVLQRKMAFTVYIVIYTA